MPMTYGRRMRPRLGATAGLPAGVGGDGGPLTGRPGGGLTWWAAIGSAAVGSDATSPVAHGSTGAELSRSSVSSSAVRGWARVSVIGGYDEAAVACCADVAGGGGGGGASAPPRRERARSAGGGPGPPPAPPPVGRPPPGRGEAAPAGRQ